MTIGQELKRNLCKSYSNSKELHQIFLMNLESYQQYDKEKEYQQLQASFDKLLKHP
ncbi:hypothetical protein [Sediminibacillus terrae]|uniref:hypothetical protein n=1 Tax=Sediminibacillus terrae TaxID=1562106 RepID=UPI00129712BA|nr:hypothetical protein [Sediminibacillus terrae]